MPYTDCHSSEWCDAGVIMLSVIMLCVCECHMLCHNSERCYAGAINIMLCVILLSVMLCAICLVS